MRIRDQTGDGAQNGERFYFEVCRTGDDVRFVEGYMGIVLFVDIKIFHKTLPKEVIERGSAFLEVLPESVSLIQDPEGIEYRDVF